MRVLFVGGTGPVGQSSLPHLLADSQSVAVAHTGAHEPPDIRTSSIEWLWEHRAAASTVTD